VVNLAITADPGIGAEDSTFRLLADLCDRFRQALAATFLCDAAIRGHRIRLLHLRFAQRFSNIKSLRLGRPYCFVLNDRSNINADANSPTWVMRHTGRVLLTLVTIHNLIAVDPRFAMLAISRLASIGVSI